MSPSYGVTSAENWTRFLVIESVEGGKTLSSLSPFVIDKVIKGLIGTVEHVSKMRSGGLLVEVNSSKQAEITSKLSLFFDIPVRVTPHRTLNSCKGVVRSYDLSQMDVIELIDELKDYRVTDVKNISVTRNGIKKKTATMIITFATAEIPERIKAGYYSLPVDRYIPNPLRCFKCQKFGHSQSTCKHEETCAKCGLKAHGETECIRQQQCVNCKGQHPSFSRDCPAFKQEKEICKVKTEQKLSFPEAKKIVLSNSNIKRTSYAAVASRLLKDASTQTEVIHCKCIAPEPARKTNAKTTSSSQTNTESNAPKIINKNNNNRNRNKLCNSQAGSSSTAEPSNTMRRATSLSPGRGKKAQVGQDVPKPPQSGTADKFAVPTANKFAAFDEHSAEKMDGVEEIASSAPPAGADKSSSSIESKVSDSKGDTQENEMEGAGVSTSPKGASVTVGKSPAKVLGDAAAGASRSGSRPRQKINYP